MSKQNIINSYDILEPQECQIVWDEVYSVDNPEALPWESVIPIEQIELFLKEVTRRCIDLGKLRILDFGCGTGRLGRYIESHHSDLIGKVYYYDISEKALDICKNIYHIPIEQLIYPTFNNNTPIEHLSNDNVLDRFDGIIMWGVFHHLNKAMQDSTLKLVKRTLKPNGIILVADFNKNDVLYNNTTERISEITGRKTYSINFNKLFGQSFNILHTNYFSFEEKQEILEQKVKQHPETRLHQTRNISYALVEFSLLGRLKESVIIGFDSSDFAHFLEYKFLSSLDLPDNSTSEYYANNPKSSKRMWLLSMGLLAAYDKYKNEGKALLKSSFSSMLFRKTLRRNSFIVTSRIDSSISEIQIELSRYDNDMFVNLYELSLSVPKDLNTSSFEINYQNIKRKKFDWNYETSHIYNNENSYHKGAINQLNILSSEGFSLFDEKELSIVFPQIDNKLDVFLEEHSELQDLRQAILMILLFVYPIDSELSCSSLSNRIEKTYLALVPPAFANPIMKDSRQYYKEISAGGAILYSMGDPFLGISEKKSKFLWDVMKWSSALTAKEVAEFTLKESEKSAKAAIMSRNMSHNIGSHVMSYLKQHLSSVTTIINDNVLAEIIKASDVTAVQSDTPLPFLVGMGHFLSYIQERQDFIATIATDYIPYFASINFKDFVYDELNPDKRFERHKDRKNLQPDNIMLGNIARSEGLGRKIQTTSKRSGQLSDIVLNFRDSKGNIFDGEPVVNSSNVVIAGRKEASKALEAMRKLEVSLPGGVIGRQAIFSIIENIIRNAAKHGNWRNQGKLELTFDFIDEVKLEEFARLKQREFELKNKRGELSESEQSEYNNIKEELEKRNKDAASIETFHPWPGRDKHLSLMEVLWLFYSQSLDADDLYFLTITDNIAISESAVYKLRDAIIEPYIDNDSKMKEGNKGIKEIRISAAWLRGAKSEDDYFKDPQDENPQTEKKAPLLYVRQHYGCLQYIICLQKPRNVAVVTQEPLSLKAITALKKVNWRYYSPENYIKERNKSYRFTLCENHDIYNTIRPFSSSRVYVQDSDTLWKSIKNGLSESESIKNERLLYESLVKDKATIWIDDDKAMGGMSSIISDDVDYAIQEDDGSYKVKDVDVCVIDGCHSHVDYLYRKHHDTLNQFTTFMSVNPNGCQFVESITGDTSTDRLVRNEKYDFRWYYSHLHAMQKKVAIFDERLFSRIYGLEEADFTKGSASDLKELKKKYCEQYPIYKRRINDFNTFDDLNKFIETKKLSIISVSKNDVYTKDYIALTYYQKGVSFYTLIKDPIKESEPKPSFGVYGLFFEGENARQPQCDAKYACRCERVATILWIEQSLHVVFENSSAKHIENHFDFISIHQGLLDKLYEAYDIKYSPEDKIKLTTVFFAKFGSNSFDTDNENEWKHGFVPGLIVHSGRSKPTEGDMPQMLPFIQYASIEHAVLDCKYSLIDLLENARYEQ